MDLEPTKIPPEIWDKIIPANPSRGKGMRKKWQINYMPNNATVRPEGWEKFTFKEVI